MPVVGGGRSTEVRAFMPSPCDPVPFFSLRIAKSVLVHRLYSNRTIHAILLFPIPSRLPAFSHHPVSGICRLSLAPSFA